MCPRTLTHRLTKMYEKWLDDDGTQMQLTKSKIKVLKDKIDAVMKSQDAHQDALSSKEDLVNEKEDILTVCGCILAGRANKR